MLKAITIENFKSFHKKQSLPLAPLTLMIGANASGKSNAIEAFRFLSFLAEGQKLSALQHNVDDSNRIFRGSSRDLAYWGEEEFMLGCTLNLSYYIKDRNWKEFSIELGTAENELDILQEKITSDTDSYPLYQVASDTDTAGIFRVDVYLSESHQLYKLCSNQIAILCQLDGYKNSFNSLMSDTVFPTIKNFKSHLQNNLFIDPIPSTMRGDSFPSSKLDNDCSNLAGVLQVLCEGPDKKALLLQFIQSLPEQNFTDIKFQDDRRGRYFFELIETFGGTERPCLSELLSDGTLRVLAVAAALITAPEGSTVVIEEVDNGIHPSRAHDLLALMLEKAIQRKIRLLITTHNPALMDALPDEALGDVVFSYRDPEEGDSRLVRLSDLDDYAGLVLQGPLGDLVTRGVVDRFVKNPVSPEEKKKNALEWVEQMRGIGE